MVCSFFSPTLKSPLEFSPRFLYNVQVSECRCDGMVDVTDSKSVGGDTVWVRVPPPAPARRKRHIACDEFFMLRIKNSSCAHSAAPRFRTGFASLDSGSGWSEPNAFASKVFALSKSSWTESFTSKQQIFVKGQQMAAFFGSATEYCPCEARINPQGRCDTGDLLR